MVSCAMRGKDLSSVGRVVGGLLELQLLRRCIGMQLMWSGHIRQLIMRRVDGIDGWHREEIGNEETKDGAGEKKGGERKGDKSLDHLSTSKDPLLNLGRPSAIERRATWV